MGTPFPGADRVWWVVRWPLVIVGVMAGICLIVHKIECEKPQYYLTEITAIKDVVSEKDCRCRNSIQLYYLTSGTCEDRWGNECEARFLVDPNTPAGIRLRHLKSPRKFIIKVEKHGKTEIPELSVILDSVDIDTEWALLRTEKDLK